MFGIIINVTSAVALLAAGMPLAAGFAALTATGFAIGEVIARIGSNEE